MKHRERIATILVSAFFMPVGVHAQLDEITADLDCPGPGCPSVRVARLSDLVEGDRLVQLGAYEDRRTAALEAQRIMTRHPDYFSGWEGAESFFIEPAESGGRLFFRLRFGVFADLAGARSFCRVLVATGDACIPVTQREVVRTRDPEGQFPDEAQDKPPSS